MGKAFQDTKTALAGAALLTHPRPNAPTSLTVHASEHAMGPVLQQQIHRSWQPLAFFIKQLCLPKKYSTFDHELLALYLGVRHFRYFQEGREFIASTDLKPLTFCMANISDTSISRQQRHLAYISEYTMDIRLIQGKDNPVADALSWSMIATIQKGIDYAAMAASLKDEPEVQSYRTASSGLRLKDIPFGTKGTTLLCDISTSQPRAIVLVEWRRRILDLIHGLSHASIHTAPKLMAAKFIWHGLQNQVRIWAKSCVHCQTSKIQ